MGAASSAISKPALESKVGLHTLGIPVRLSNTFITRFGDRSVDVKMRTCLSCLGAALLLLGSRCGFSEAAAYPAEHAEQYLRNGDCESREKQADG